jgi:hypothetical protein
VKVGAFRRPSVWKRIHSLLAAIVLFDFSYFFLDFVGRGELVVVIFTNAHLDNDT